MNFLQLSQYLLHICCIEILLKLNTFVFADTQIAQKVKCRSSSSEQLTSPSLTKSTGSSRRFDALSRKIRKDSVIDRLRKEKMNKVFALNRKLSTGNDPISKHFKIASPHKYVIKYINGSKI